LRVDVKEMNKVLSYGIFGLLRIGMIGGEGGVL
jgi:hypothetical protein